jgi:inorganic pyrophosphatase
LERGVFVLEQVLYSPFKSPIEYGMIAQTIGDDGTPAGHHGYDAPASLP